jgi:hypothetical protein
MKTSSFVIFLSIVLTIYTLGNIYVYIHGINAVGNIRWLKAAYIAAFILCYIAYIAARFLQPHGDTMLSNTLLTIGSFWMAALVYFFVISLGIDIIRLANHYTGFYPDVIKRNYENVKLILFFSSIAVVMGLLIYGYINAHTPVVKDITLDINKSKGSAKTINVVMVSDIHLGLFSKGEWFDGIVNKINALEPDVVLLAGDVIDEDIRPVINQNLGEHLKNIKSKYGVYAVTGNHEYIGGAEPAVKYLTEHNIIMLRDTAVLINNDFYIAGREDRDRVRFTGKERKSLDEILKNVDTEYPVLLMNHQPFNLPELEGRKVDVSLSGHTHHGQFWPLNLVTNMIYEISRGYIFKYGTHIYVSNGVGTWGPPVRIGNTPEIMHFTINVLH